MALIMSGTGLTFSDNSTQTTGAAPMGVLSVGHTGCFTITSNGGPYYTGDSISGSYVYRMASSSGVNRTFFYTGGVWLGGNFTNFTSSNTGAIGMLGGGTATWYNNSGTWRFLGNWVIPIPGYDAYSNYTSMYSALLTRVT